MIKQSIYPKTPRVGNKRNNFIITEKLDGSNLCIFKYEDKLHFAQRNTILTMEDLTENSKLFYKGLVGWIQENIEQLNNIMNNAVLCGEWIGMGKIGYGGTDIDKKFYMFAKANIIVEDGNFSLKNIIYKQDLFKYSFIEQQPIECVGVVPVVVEEVSDVSIAYLDDLYEDFTKDLGRNCEGFIIYNEATNKIDKYVRMKDGKMGEFLTSHSKQVMKYFWFKCPYDALICAKNESDAINMYKENVADLSDDDIPADGVRVLTIHEAIRMMKNVDQELSLMIRGNELTKPVVLLYDRKLL